MAVDYGSAIGAAHRRVRETREDTAWRHQANANMAEANRRLKEAEPLAADYNAWLDTKKFSPLAYSFDIYAEMRPDLRDASKDTLDQRRVFNLHLVAWAEWWVESVRGSELIAKEKAPKLRGLSELMKNGSIDTADVAKALEDIADRLELSQGLSDPRKWVKQRVNKMWKQAKWQKNEPAVPVMASLRPHPPAMQKRFEDENLDPIEGNLYGIQDMMMK